MLVPHEHVQVMWGVVWPSIQAALRGTMSTLPRFQEAVFDGRLMLWVVRKDGRFVGHFTLQEVFGPEGDSGLRVVTLGGEGGKHWVPLVHSLVAEQVRAGTYDSGLATCRPGMMRWLTRLGWRVRRYEMEYRNG